MYVVYIYTYPLVATLSLKFITYTKIYMATVSSAFF